MIRLDVGMRSPSALVHRSVCIPDGSDEAEVHGHENDQWSDVQADEIESTSVNVVVVRVVERGTVDHHCRHHRR